MKNHYFKLVCVNEGNPFEYEILEDVNVSDLDEVHNIVKNKFPQYIDMNVKWILLPFTKIF